MYLPDISFWLSLAFEVHVHHSASKAWFEQTEPQSCSFCRFTQQGFLRLATNPSVFGRETVKMELAWSLYDGLLLDERVIFLSEPNGLEDFWREYTKTGGYSHRTWSDAYLAAFARAANLELLTLDGGFLNYPDLSIRIIGK